MTTPHERSVGAAMERKAIRAYLRRQETMCNRPDTSVLWALGALVRALKWLDKRRARYDQRKGGLGKR